MGITWSIDQISLGPDLFASLGVGKYDPKSDPHIGKYDLKSDPHIIKYDPKSGPHIGKYDLPFILKGIIYSTAPRVGRKPN